MKNIFIIFRILWLIIFLQPLTIFAISLDKVEFKSNMRIGLFIGTFDPPTLGHDHIAHLAIEQANLDLLIIIANDLNVHKRNATPLTYRLDMLHAAYLSDPKIAYMEEEDFEWPRTLKIIDFLKSKCSTCTIVGIGGSDILESRVQRLVTGLLLGLKRWHIVMRDGDTVSGHPSQTLPVIHAAEMFKINDSSPLPMPISSTAVRKYFAKNPHFFGDFLIQAPCPFQVAADGSRHEMLLPAVCNFIRRSNASYEQYIQRPGVETEESIAKSEALSTKRGAGGSSESGPSRPKMVVFGDSISDDGKGSALIREQWWSTFTGQIPGAPFHEGRFTNGKVWAEVLAEKMHRSLDDRAVSGMRVYDQGMKIPVLCPAGLACPFGGTVSQYIQDNRGRLANPDYSTLYLIWIGGNNYIHFAKDHSSLTTTGLGLDAYSVAEDYANHVVTGIMLEVEALYRAGARNIIIMNLGESDNTPMVRYKHIQNSQLLSNLVLIHNQQLSASLTSFYSEHVDPSQHILLYNAYEALESLTADAWAYGILHVSVPCYTGGIRGSSGKGCENPNQYWYWDFVHPTARAHEIIAGSVYNFIQTHHAVFPESAPHTTPATHAAPSVP